MRLFVAILFPEPVRKALMDTMAQMRAQGAHGNFTRPENLHLTLAFLGETGAEGCRAAVRAVDSVCGRAPFSLSLGGEAALACSGGLACKIARRLPPWRGMRRRRCAPKVFLSIAGPFNRTSPLRAKSRRPCPCACAFRALLSPQSGYPSCAPTA